MRKTAALRTKNPGQSSSPTAPAYNGEMEANPLETKSPRAWDALVDAIGPASLLVVIDARLGPALRARVSAEDILQESLLQAWRDRAQCKWDGLASFRRWLLGIAEHRIRDAVDYFAAKKRGEGRAPQSLVRAGVSTRSGGEVPFAIQSTTPSRLAQHREQAEQMRLALDSLDEETREVLQLRLFEGRSMAEIAEQLGIGVAAAKYRFRKGAQRYRARLFQALGTTTQNFLESKSNSNGSSASLTDAGRGRSSSPRADAGLGNGRDAESGPGPGE